MGKRKHGDDDHLRKKIKKLEERLLQLEDNRGREMTPHDSTPPLTNQESENTTTGDDELPEDFLLALGNEGQDKKELGPIIRPELATRWTKIMSEGLGKEARDTLIKKYPTPANFSAAVAPVLNLEISASMSELSHKRDKRIVQRQNMLGSVMTGLGKTLTDIFKGELNTKTLIEVINDAAKITADIYYQDSASRKFFALAGTSKVVQDAIKNEKSDEYLFGKDCSEKISAAQKIQKTGAQLRPSEKTTVKKATNTKVFNKKQVNWKGPLQQQRARSGCQHPQQLNNKQKQTRYNQPHQKQQRRMSPRSNRRYNP